MSTYWASCRTRSMRIVTRRWVARCLSILLAAALCRSQTGTGNIQGTVKDISGAVVPKAKVTLVHTATNRQYRTETTEVGFYLFPSIQLGDYQLTVELPGMETWKGQLHLLAGQTAEVEAVLKPGSTATTVEIRSEVAPLVTTTSATLATVVEPQRIEQLPVNGRYVDNLLFMTTPGAVQDAYSAVGAYRVPEVYGLRFATELTQDGAPLENRAWGTESARPPGMDSGTYFQREGLARLGPGTLPGNRQRVDRTGPLQRDSRSSRRALQNPNRDSGDLREKCGKFLRHEAVLGARSRGKPDTQVAQQYSPGAVSDLLRAGQQRVMTIESPHSRNKNAHQAYTESQARHQ